MAKELLLYNPIYNFVAEALINQLEEAKGEDVNIRMNTPGGSPLAGWGIIAKIKEHDGKVTIKVDGSAMSMGAFMLPFASYVEALDVSKIMLHRADMYVSSPEDQAFLNDVNKDLRSKLEAKIDDNKLRELKGVGIKEIFESEKRIDVYLNGREAKQIGLVNKVVKLEPNDISAFNNHFFSIAAHANEPVKSEPKKSKNMTLNELKTQHPEVYAQAVNEGVAAERDRAGAWLTFVDTDAQAVSKGIKDGKNLSATEMAELTVKKVSAQTLKNIEAGNTKPIATDEPNKEPEGAKTEKQKAVAEFEKEVKSILKQN